MVASFQERERLARSFGVAEMLSGNPNGVHTDQGVCDGEAFFAI